jgi:hypothetical protein
LAAQCAAKSESSVPNLELRKPIEQAVKPADPQDQDDHDQPVQDRFDLALHGNEAVHKPEDDSHGDNCDDYGGQGHFWFSIRVAFRGVGGKSIQKRSVKSL